MNLVGKSSAPSVPRRKSMNMIDRRKEEDELVCVTLSQEKMNVFLLVFAMSLVLSLRARVCWFCEREIFVGQRSISIWRGGVHNGLTCAWVVFARALRSS